MRDRQIWISEFALQRETGTFEPAHLERDELAVDVEVVELHVVIFQMHAVIFLPQSPPEYLQHRLGSLTAEQAPHEAFLVEVDDPEDLSLLLLYSVRHNVDDIQFHLLQVGTIANSSVPRQDKLAISRVASESEFGEGPADIELLQLGRYDFDIGEVVRVQENGYRLSLMEVDDASRVELLIFYR